MMSKNKNRWRCFHCSEEFTDYGEAECHFGSWISSIPICKVDAEQYRKLEEEVQEWRNESTPLQREIDALHARIAEVERKSEEQGYARGLADAKKFPQELGLMPIPSDPGQ